MGPRAGLDGGNFRPSGIRSPDRPAPIQSLYRLNYRRAYLITVIMQFKIGTVDKTSRLRHEVSTSWRCSQHNRTYATFPHEP